MLKKIPGYLLLLSIIAATGYLFYLWSPKKSDLVETDKNITILQEKAAIGTSENPQARFDYLNRMLVDPKTGKIPPNIRQKELRFSKTIPTRDKVNRLFRHLSTEDLGIENWQPRGPFNFGGRTRALALDITNENIILSGGTSGGMWRSENGGQSWEKVTAAESLHSVTAIAQDTRPGKGNIWYYGTGEIRGQSARGGRALFMGDGVFKSVDGGKTWGLLPSTSDGQVNTFNSQFNFINSIVTNPANLDQDEVLVAAFGGILRSIDGGFNWDLVLGDGLIDEASFHTDIAIDINGVMYAALSEEALQDESAITQGIFRSVNGRDWINITPPGFPVRHKRTVIGISPSNPNIVYFITNSNPLTFYRYTYISGDGSGTGGRWENLSANIPAFGGEVGDYDTQDSYNMVVEVHPEDENIVYLGGTNLYRSSSGFTNDLTTTWIGGYDTVNNASIYPMHHPDQHVVVFYPSNPDRMLSAHDGGLSITENNLAEDVSWTRLNNGYVTGQFYTIALDPSAVNDLALGGLQDNGSLITGSSDFRGSWQRLIGADGGYTAITEDGFFYYVSFQMGQVFRLTLDEDFRLTSFAQVDPLGAGELENQEFLFINPYVLDPNNNNKMYFAGGDKIWRNDNLSQVPVGIQKPTLVNWEDLPSTQVDTSQISNLAISTNPANVLYYGTTDGRLFKVNNAHLFNPATLEITSIGFPEDGYVSNIAVNPLDANKVIVIFSNYNIRSIFYSEDGGQSFTDVSGDLEEFPDGSGNGPSIRWGEILPLENGNTLYMLGTSTGLYSTKELAGNKTIWAKEGPETIGNVVVPMLRYRSLDGQVVVATHGNGVYSKKFEGVLPVQKEQPRQSLSLEQNFPNPFTPGSRTTIKFFVPETSTVRVKILNTLGQDIKTLLWAVQYAGENEISWDGTNAAGAPLPNGIYLYRMEYRDKEITKKLILTR